MNIVCPTITAYDPHEYREQLARVEKFSKRIHIDVMDGEFAPIKSLPLVQTYWPDEVLADIHLMYERPLEYIETLVSLDPHMVIIQAESQGDLGGLIHHLQQFSIKVGVAVLHDTTVDQARPLIELADHVLIFSGKLGYHGGQADLTLLEKVAAIKSISPDIEIGWDGGINDSNIAALAEAGVSVLDVGNGVHSADHPDKAFEQLQQLANS